MSSSGADIDIAVKRASTQSEWLTKSNYEEAESNYQRHLAKLSGKVKEAASASTFNVDQATNSVATGINKCATKNKKGSKLKKNSAQLCSKAKKNNVNLTENSLVTEGKSSLVDEIARTRQQIKHSLLSCELNEDLKSGEKSSSSDMSALLQRLAQVELDNKKLHTVIEKLQTDQRSLESRFAVLEKSKGNQTSKTVPKVTEAKKSESKDDADDDVDLFASEEEDEGEREALHNQRVKAYEEKKSKKAAIIAKSNIILDIKPWDDETDMKNMEASVRTIQMDGLVWGAAKLQPLAYGIFKLQISCVVEDDKVSVDDLQEKIEGFEELVQSVDIAAFNKV